jgi:tRNA threonylcarbamoyladenosine modification (KEOPS) complex  Pcc1 subunit
LEFGNAVNVNTRLQAVRTILTLEKYKANFSIFFKDSSNSFSSSSLFFEKKDQINDQQNILKKKLLNAVYVALKGDIYSSPNLDTIINISLMDGYILFGIVSNDQSKFRSSISSFIRLINLVYTILYNNMDDYIT